MKNEKWNMKGIIYLLGFIILACSSDHSPVPLKFRAYEANPILSPGEPGEWDELVVLIPSAIRHDNIFYLFYSGWHKNGQVSIGLATSEDGYHFTKYPGNPILAPREKGYDSFHVGAPVFIREDSTWFMYYNARETSGYGPGPFIGRATAKKLTGPWERMDQPVLARGHRSEWDGGYMIPSTILKKQDGTYMLWYTGGANFTDRPASYIGLATSADGINWIKYNNPATTDHPFADSDPVLTNTKHSKPYNDYPWTPYVLETSMGFEMYFSYQSDQEGIEKSEIGYATSPDGIHWKKYSENPVYGRNDDHVTANNLNRGIMEFPSLVFIDSLCFMYFDYGQIINSIGVATAKIPTPKHQIPDKSGISNSK
jgi:predicted GH43/DUF377 family glycosyl hydrolase